VSPIPPTPAEFLEACRRCDRLARLWEVLAEQPFPDLEARARDFEVLAEAAVSDLEQQLALDRARGEVWAWWSADVVAWFAELGRRSSKRRRQT
jgi:hypothetical protein